MNRYLLKCHGRVLVGVLSLVLVVAPSGVLAQDANQPQAGDGSEPAASTYTVAVLPFVAGSPDFEQIAPQVSDLVNLHLSAHTHLSLVERAELDKITGELELGQSGTVSSATAAQIGHLTGAAILVAGRVFAVQNELYVVARVISVETGKSFGEFVAFPFQGSHDTGAKTLADKIAAGVAKRGDTFVSAPRDGGSGLLESLLIMVEGKDLPVVSVTVAERHVGRRSIDPAAETEISILLQKLGFELVEAETTTVQPDIEIRGEAFSEFAMRKGNLVSCKGRVEVKAVERLTGRIIAVDRQTDVVADISEQIAAKAAIQKAAATLAERVVLRMVKSLDE